MDFVAVENFDFASALIQTDDRKDYGEDRRNALGLIGTRLHVLTWRDKTVRVISLRKANAREVKSYERFKA